MKRIWTLLIALVLFLGCTSCGNPAPKTGDTFTDDLGRTVSVDHPQRVAVLLASYADVWMLAGGTVCAAPDDAWEDYDFDLAEDTVNLGGTKSLSLELLLGSDPDFIIASSNSSQHVEWQQTLESAGIPTAYFSVSDYDDYLRMLKICTDITGRPELYETNGAALQERIGAILERCRDFPPQKVLVLRASAARVRAKNSQNNVMGEMLAAFGCKNIADSDAALLENLNIESIVLENPDKIFIVETGDNPEGIRKSVQKLFQENPLWQQLDAVKNNRVYFMGKQLYNMKPNARWAEAYEKLETILYGEQ